MDMASSQPIYQEQLDISPSLTPGSTMISSELSSPLSMAVNPMTTLAVSTPESNYLVDYGFPQIHIPLTGVSITDSTAAHPYPTMSMPIGSPIATAFSGVGTAQQPIKTRPSLSAAIAANAFSRTPPTPIPTPTVPSLSEQMSPMTNKFPEFHEYNHTRGDISADTQIKKRTKFQQRHQPGTSNRSTSALNAEIRRQVHIQSEQKRRAQIKDGFEDLRRHLSNCNSNKKISKSAILNKTVTFIQQLKHNQATLLAELERLHAENDRLKQCVFASQNSQQ